MQHEAIPPECPIKTDEPSYPAPTLAPMCGIPPYRQPGNTSRELADPWILVADRSILPASVLPHRSLLVQGEYERGHLGLIALRCPW